MNGGFRLSLMDHFPGAERLWRRLVLVLALAFVNPLAFGQEATVFALRGDGTATVVVDKAAHKAWITDGGRSGTQGVREARVGQQDMLTYLQSIGIVDLAIICSHPHSDHMGGLEDTIQDSRILGFGSILIVDNGLAHERSLAGLFEKKWASSPLKKPEVKYASAERAEVFSKSKMAGESVRVTNFAYNPDKVGRGEHDRSVIMQYALPGADNRVMVDFDDASEALVKRWVERKGAKATVVIHPHHGSRNNSISALIKNKERIGLRDVVITVNRYNRYLHPAPEVFLDLLERLGPNHVFVTDSDIGENITVTGKETLDGRNIDDHVARLRSFAVAQRERFEAKLRHKFQTDAQLDPIAINASWNLDQQKARPKRSKDDVPSAVRTLLEGVLAYDKAIAILDNKASAKGFGIPPFKPRRRPPPEESRGGSPDFPPDKPSGGTGSFFDLERRASIDLGTAGRKSTNTSARFLAELERKSPRYGGIVIGNQAAAKIPSQNVAPKSLDFVDAESVQNDAQKQVAIRVVLADGSTVDYANVTNSELWVAYNFVQPSGHLQKLYKRDDVDLTSPAVIGLSNIRSGQRVALSPAFAGTTAGWNAIYADGIIGKAYNEYKAGNGKALPIVLRSIDWPNFRWEILQWYDAKAVVHKTYASFSVIPEAAPSSCLLRMRIAARTNPLSASARDQEVVKVATGMLKEAYPGKAEKLLAEARKYLKSRSQKGRLPSLDQLPGLDIQSDLFRDITLPPKNAKDEMEAIVVVLAATGKSSDDTEAFFERAEQRVSDAEGWKSMTWSPESLVGLCAEYPPLAAMDRMARLIALLNWYTRTTGNKMPELPSWANPVWKPTPDTLSTLQDPYWATMAR